MTRPYKHPESVRREIYERYLEFLANRPQKICSEHGVSRGTLLAYVKEFSRREGEPVKCSP